MQLQRGPVCRCRQASRRNAAPRASAATTAPNAVALASVKASLLTTVAPLNRGSLATSSDRAEVVRLVERLESMSAIGYGYVLDKSALDGRWQLMYTSVEQFRSSPFFWAFQEGLVGNRDIADQIFKFTDNIPGATIGTAYQSIDFNSGKLVSEVDLEVDWTYPLPSVNGTVVTTCEVELQPPNRLLVTVENTRVKGSNLPLFNSIVEAVVVPVKMMIERVRGDGSTRVAAEVTFLDQDIRITRTRPDDSVFIYRRC